MSGTIRGTKQGGRIWIMADDVIAHLEQSAASYRQAALDDPSKELQLISFAKAIEAEIKDLQSTLSSEPIAHYNMSKLRES